MGSGAAEVRIPLFERPGWSTNRREARENLVRQVDYCRFPRVCADQRLRVGFTRDLSQNGLCLRASSPEPIGALLRVTLRSLDGSPRREALARVAWTAPDGAGDHFLGLALLETKPGQPLRLRYVPRAA